MVSVLVFSNTLDEAGVDLSITPDERGKLVECVGDLWETTVEYTRKSWSLCGSIVVAPEQVQRHLRTTAATTEDVRGLLQRPYFQKSHRTKAKIWSASITKADSGPSEREEGGDEGTEEETQADKGKNGLQVGPAVEPMETQRFRSEGREVR